MNYLQKLGEKDADKKRVTVHDEVNGLIETGYGPPIWPGQVWFGDTVEATNNVAQSPDDSKAVAAELDTALDSEAADIELPADPRKDWPEEWDRRLTKRENKGIDEFLNE